MPRSTHNPIFLLDENVNFKLYKFLKLQGIDAKLTPKTLQDKDIAEICLKENRILVTNDEDFLEYSSNEIYSVILLRIPQNKPGTLVKSFEKLLSECKNFSGRVIILSEFNWKAFSLYQKLN